jgi:hypothetical protein
MAQRQWNRIRRNKARTIEAESYAKAGEETKKFLAKLDAVQKEFAAATPAEREVILRRILGDVGQV